MSKCWTIVTAGLLLAVPCQAQDVPAKPEAQQAGAQVQAPQWPANLKHRNARYAHLIRAEDLAEDARQARLAQAWLERTGDTLGDREELRRAIAAAKVPPRASLDAVLARSLDEDGDRVQEIVARRTTLRHAAELRRFADFKGDREEIAKFKRDRLRFSPDPNGEVFTGEDRRNEDSVDFSGKREDIDREKNLDSESDVERRQAGKEERDDDFLSGRGDRDPLERREDGFGSDDPLGGGTDENLGIGEDADAALEKADEKAAAEADAKLDAEAEKADEDTAREEDREAERQIQTEEQNTPGN